MIIVIIANISHNNQLFVYMTPKIRQSLTTGLKYTNISVIFYPYHLVFTGC